MRILNKALSLLAIGSMTLLAGCDAEKDLRLVEIPEKDIAYEQLYILGYSVQQYVDGDPFVSNTAVPMDPTDDPNVFTKRVEMYYYKDNKQFKFCDAQDDWNKIHYIVPESGVVDGTAYAYVEVGENANRGAVCSEGAGNLRDNFWGIREGEDGVYDVTINGKTLDISVVLVEKKEQPFAPEELYMVGDGTTAGWNISSPVPMEMTLPQVFEYTGPLYAGELKCPMQVSDKWEAPFIMPAVHETKINRNGVEAPECEYVPTGNPDSKWRIEEEGTYHLTIDCSKGKNEITIAAEYLGEIVRGPELYMLGNAAASFDSNNPLAMDYDDATGTFSWEGPIYFADKNATTQNANKQFKFVSRPGNWDAVDYYIPEKASADGYIGVIGEGTHQMKICTWKNGSTGIDAFWGIASGKDGVYRIEVNLDAMTFTFTRTGDAEPQPEPELETELYMQGVAGRSGCDSNNPGVQMARVGDTHTFTWDGELYYTEEEGNRQFNFITSKGNWDAVYFIVPENGDSDQYRELVEDGQTYKMKRIKGAGQPLSASWGIAKENNGRYHIEANLETMELKVTRLDNATGKRVKNIKRIKSNRRIR